MDIFQLATAVLAALSPYLIKGGEAIAGELGKSALHKAEGLLKVLSSHFAAEPQAKAEFDAYLDDPSAKAEAFHSTLVETATQNAALKTGLERVLKGDRAEVVLRLDVDKADEATALRNAKVRNAKIDAEMKAKSVKKVIGIDGGEFG